MKNFNIAILTVSVILALMSCKDKSTDNLPRDAYSQNPEGIIMKAAPDVKSTMVTVIPFAEKITLTADSDSVKPAGSPDKTKWYRTTWNGQSGWVHESSISGVESVTEQIKISFTEQSVNLSDEFKKSFEASPLTIKNKYSYPGGEMAPAKIFFLSGSTMVVNSKIFTEQYSNTFFQYEFLNEGKLLKIKFIDSKLNFDEYADVENSSRSVFKIDKNERAIIYQIKDNGFFFFNWGFVKE